MQPITAEKENQVIDLILLGNSWNYIAKETSIGKGSIEKIIHNRFKKVPRPQLNSMLDLAKSLKKAKISYSEAFSGAMVYSIARKLNLDDDKIHDFISGVYSECSRIGLDPVILTEYANILFRLGASFKIPLEDVPHHIESLLQEKNSLDDCIAKLMQQKTFLEEEKNSILREKNVILDMLNNFESTRDALERFGIPVEDLIVLANIMRQAAKLRYDVSKIIEFTSKEDTFEKRRTSLETEIKQLQKTKAEKVLEISRLESMMESVKSLVLQVERLTKLGIQSDELEDLHGIINTMAKKHGSSPKMALQRLRSEMKNYDKIVDFKVQAVSLKKQISESEKELASLNKNLNNVKSEYNKKSATIDTITRLQKVGIDPALISQWRTILQESSVNLSSFDDTLKRFGSLKKLVRHISSVKEKLEKEKAVLESQTSTLSNQKDSLEASILQIQESAIKTIESAKTNANDSILETLDTAKNSIDHTKSHAKETIDSLGFESRSMINQVTAATQEDLANAVKTFDSMIANISTTSEDFGRYTSLRPLYELVVNTKGESRMVYLAMNLLLDRFLDWSQIQESLDTGVKTYANNLKKSVEKELRSHV